jgi:UDP-N-acetylmuramoyl-tripeptide--D-alanyl-D-alanine ligase
MNWQYTIDDLAAILGVPPPDGDAVVFSGVSTDTRTLQPGQAFFALSGERFDGNDFLEQALFAGAAVAVGTRGSTAGPCLVVGDTLQALQQFAAHHRRRFSIPVYALTGSCGKTTTKDMITELLSTKYRVLKTPGNMNNEIGCPLTLLRLDETTEIAVIEMGANHIGEIERLCTLARPTASAITMIAPAHLEGFGSIENVARAKSEIVFGLALDGTFFVNNDDPRCVKIGEDFRGNKVTFGTNGDVSMRALEFVEGGMLLHVDPVGPLRLPLYSRAHAQNVLLAVAVGSFYGISEFEAPLRRACMTGTRCTILRVGPLEIIDDTYNASPRSMEAALEILSRRPTKGSRMAALGSMLELGESAEDLHRQTGHNAAVAGVNVLLARGPHAEAVVAGARAGGVARAEVVDDHGAIARAIAETAAPGDVLLVKGSRGMRMEGVIAGLRAIYEPADVG